MRAKYSVIVAENRFGYYCVPRSYTARNKAATTVLDGGVYEAVTIEFISKHFAGGNVAHAGAYFGDFLPALGARCKKVWAFEPHPESAYCAGLTIQINSLKNVQLFPLALWKHREIVHFRVRGDGAELGGQSRIAGDHEDGVICVEAEALDSFEFRDVDLIHLDVEGGEEDALNGGLKTIERELPSLILEHVSSGTSQLIAQFGYRQVQKVGRNYLFEVR